ncbi:hypothetical protein EAO75_02885, partial [Streptomyces sp. uw30]
MTQLKELVTAGVWRRGVDAVVEEEQRRSAQTPTPNKGEGPTLPDGTKVAIRRGPGDKGAEGSVM